MNIFRKLPQTKCKLIRSIRKSNIKLIIYCFCLMRIFNKINYSAELYIVGGAVRDFLLDRMVHDIDLTTNFTLKEMIDICCRLKLRYYLKSSSYQTLCII